MRSRRRRLRAALLLTVAAVAAVLGLLALETDVIRDQELDTVDARFAIRGERDAPERVAVIGIDDKTFDELDLRWPFRRHLHAQAIDRLKAAGAKVIVYDLQFTEPSEREADDIALLEATQRAGNVVLATSETGPRGETDVFGGDDVVREARARVGNAYFDPDHDGTWRRVPYEHGRLESLSVVAAQRAGARVERDGYEPDGGWIDFAGPPGTIETHSFVDLLRGRVAAERLRGRIVVVGLTAPSEQDVHPTPFGPGLTPGAEVQATAVETALAGMPLDEAPGWLAVLVVLVAAVATPLSGLRLTGLRPLLVGLGLIAVYLVAAQLAFNGGLILPVAAPLVAAAVALVGSLAVYYATELRERQRLRTQFARFVPPAVVDDVVERTEDDLRLGGVRLEGTVMFCDLRGFTTWAESQDAERVIEVLNRYLTLMSDAILDEGGTVVSYMGDGIMAVFGAPLEQRDHADRALAAARRMLERCLPAFNAWLHEQGHEGEPFRMGIGLNSGPVMSGNVGSERRLEYAAVGDTTNTASRIEGLTKGTEHQLLVADSTRARLSAPDDLAEAGEHEVRGRAERVRLWTLRS